MNDPITLVDCGCRAHVYQDGSGIEIYWCTMHGKAENMEAVLEEFIEDVEATGGLINNAENPLRFVADSEWTDLAATYVRACNVLEREPRCGGEEPA